ncbi:DUF4387 domain-containing protein [Amycolatopsis pigmentata]|uniref:DUF4387 domain-containing protein n=1 Tax=Amycolatopsis pigmentata TaxID=450801 RepID=A0ABW5FZV1_9PSEU
MTETTARTVGDLAQLVRTKNAGPFWMTIDVFFATDADYQRAAAPGVISEDIVAALYGVSPSDVTVFRLPHIRVVKISFPRRVVQGSFADRDMHSGQQHVPLANLSLP